VDEFVPPVATLTLVGLSDAQLAHEGVIDVERATVPEKPLTLWRLRAVVPVCPANTVRLVGVDVRLKLGVMNVTCVVWVIVEYVPVTVTVYVPPVVAVQESSEVISQGDVDDVTLVGFTLQVIPVDGEIVVDNPTTPVNIFPPAT
jgi:hypothetical protein